MVEEAQVPYYDSLQSDPSFEEVRKVLCTENKRPHIPERWKTDDVSIIGRGKGHPSFKDGTEK